MKTLGNIIWVIFGGLHIALEYFIAGLVLMLTIIGIPFGLQSMKLGMLAIWPFGTKVKWKPSQPGCLSIFMNVLWFFVGGIWICLTHIFYGLLLCITIIGIPFGKEEGALVAVGLGVAGFCPSVFFAVALVVALLVSFVEWLEEVRLGVGLGVGVSVGRAGRGRASSE